MLVLLESQIDLAATLLLQGYLVAFPTETVYGLAAPISNSDLIEQIFQVKHRSLDNPLIIHISHIDQAIQLTKDLPSDFYRLATQFFPGPLTVVLKKGDQIPHSISRGKDTIAIRMPSHPIALKFIEKVGEPIVGTSANLSGKPSSTTVRHVMHDFPSQVKAVIDGGPTAYGIESTVLSLKDSIPRLLRPGAIPISALEKVLDKPIEIEIETTPRKKGNGTVSYQNYNPRGRLILFTTESEIEVYLNSRPPKINSFLMATQPIPGFYHVTSKNFYALIRLANELQVDEIVVFYDKVEDNFPLIDRLIKAQTLLTESSQSQ